MKQEKKVVKETMKKIVKIDETPFSLLIEDDNGVQNVKIVSGKYLCSKKVFQNETEAKRYINKKPWELIMTIFIFLKKELKDE